MSDEAKAGADDVVHLIQRMRDLESERRREAAGSPRRREIEREIVELQREVMLASDDSATASSPSASPSVDVASAAEAPPVLGASQPSALPASTE